MTFPARPLGRTLLALLACASYAVACGGSVVESGASASGGASSAGAGGSSCEQAKDGYGALLSNLLSHSANTSCAVDSDCQFVNTADCGHGCSVSVANPAGAVTLGSQLSLFAQAHSCTKCNFPESLCLSDPLAVPACVGGTCVRGGN